MIEPNLLRIVVDYRTGEINLRVLYRSNGESSHGTKKRAREIQALATAGLQDALETLREGRVSVTGSSGFSTREDSLVAEAKRT